MTAVSIHSLSLGQSYIKTLRNSQSYVNRIDLYELILSNDFVLITKSFDINTSFLTYLTNSPQKHVYMRLPYLSLRISCPFNKSCESKKRGWDWSFSSTPWYSPEKVYVGKGRMSDIYFLKSPHIRICFAIKIAAIIRYQTGVS